MIFKIAITLIEKYLTDPISGSMDDAYSSDDGFIHDISENSSPNRNINVTNNSMETSVYLSGSFFQVDMNDLKK